MFDYKLMNALWAVIREGSFEGAAKRLGITASAVSQRVKLLEGRIGQVLIVRSKPCEATPAGYRLFSHMEQVRLLEQDAICGLDGLEVFAGDSPPVLRIGVSGDSISTWFYKVILEFCAEEDVLIHILRDDREHTADALKRGEVIATVLPRERLLDGMKSMRLGKMEHSAVVSPQLYHDVFSRGITLENLSLVRCISFDEKDSLPDLWINHIFGTTVTLDAHRVPSFSGYIEVCRSGIGWGVAPSLAVKADIETGRLVELLPQNRIATELFWQHSAISSDILARLSRKVKKISGEILISRAQD